ncbi:MAG: phosphate acyltransferase PlsX [Oscillospiraceae bacterium]|jgi:glycerol-3-phosphate acyltransferase PlsX|nr:phosphate acyltransferase PlsX [Oscillospiraceae bacterium]
MKIIVDAFGGDNAPLEILKGCAMAVEEFGVELLLTGREDVIRKVAQENAISLNGMEIADAPDVIGMEEHPEELMKSKKNSSLALAMRLLAEGKGDGFVGAGSTGATLMGATLIVKRINGVKRPALAPVMPSENGKFLLIDCGANVECRPEMLVQFAKMGSVYMERAFGIAKPRIGLANIGVEETKGTELQKAVLPLLKNSGLNFIGNVESRDLPAGICDVVVADGFTGNMILKTYEGVGATLLGMIKGVLSKSAKNKLAAAIIYKDLKAAMKDMDPNSYGGAPFIGVKKPVFKAHGSSNARTFKNAIGQVIRFAEGKVIEEIESSL